MSVVACTVTDTSTTPDWTVTVMLYRLAPHSPLEWSDDFPVRDLKEMVTQHDIDLDRLDWARAEERAFSNDLLRIALRHGLPTTHGLVVEAMHTVDLGRSDHLRTNQQAMDELQAKTRADSGELMEQVMPGWTESGKALDERVRASGERVAREADEDLAEVLAATVDPALAEHWTRLGGTLPDPA